MYGNLQRYLTVLLEIHFQRCSSSEYFFKEYSKSGVVNESALEDFCPAVLYELSKEACQRELEEEEEEGGGNEDEGKGLY